MAPTDLRIARARARARGRRCNRSRSGRGVFCHSAGLRRSDGGVPTRPRRSWRSQLLGGYQNSGQESDARDESRVALLVGVAGIEAAAPLALALALLRAAPAREGRAARPRGDARAGLGERGPQQGREARAGERAIARLAPRRVGVDHELAGRGQPRAEPAQQGRALRAAEGPALAQVEAQRDAGADLVDVLAAGPARTARALDEL